MPVCIIWTVVHNGPITMIIHVSMVTHKSMFDSLCFTSRAVLIVLMQDKKCMLAFTTTHNWLLTAQFQFPIVSAAALFSIY